MFPSCHPPGSFSSTTHFKACATMSHHSQYTLAFQPQRHLHAPCALVSCAASEAIKQFVSMSSLGLNVNVGRQNIADWHGSSCNTSRQGNPLDLYILRWFSRAGWALCLHYILSLGNICHHTHRPDAPHFSSCYCVMQFKTCHL